MTQSALHLDDDGLLAWSGRGSGYREMHWLTLMPRGHMVPLAGGLHSVDLYLHWRSPVLVFLSFTSAASFLFFMGTVKTSPSRSHFIHQHPSFLSSDVCVCECISEQRRVCHPLDYKSLQAFQVNHSSFCHTGKMMNHEDVLRRPTPPSVWELRSKTKKSDRRYPAGHPKNCGRWPYGSREFHIWYILIILNSKKYFLVI